MKIKKLLLLMVLLISFSNALSINSAIKKKYPHPLLTEDYDILDENDLAMCVHERPRPFSLESSGAYRYWQCFPRKNILTFLEDSGDSAKEYGSTDTLSELTIKVYPNQKEMHVYNMRRVWPLAVFEKKFRLWHKLMLNQKYICIAGSFDSKEETVENGTLREVYFWTFDKIKTKKGSDSY